MKRTLLTAAMAVALTGCAGLRLNLINSSVRRPSNVAMYFSVDRNNGQPVGGLTADRYTIYEDDRPVSALESRQTILNPQVAAVHYTLLLMDMSGSVTESGQIPQLQEAARVFVERVERQQRVAVYAFDGSPTLTPVVPFTESAGGAAAGINALTSYRPRDPSTNLHGAVVAGLQQLDRSLASATQPLKFGTLVVFTDGTDRAARVTRDQMMEAVRVRSTRSSPSASARTSTRASCASSDATARCCRRTPPRCARRSSKSPRRSKRRRSATTSSRTALRLARGSTACASKHPPPTAREDRSSISSTRRASDPTATPTRRPTSTCAAAKGPRVARLRPAETERDHG
jgi:hypothetical protein